MNLRDQGLPSPPEEGRETLRGVGEVLGLKARTSFREV